MHKTYRMTKEYMKDENTLSFAMNLFTMHKAYRMMKEHMKDENTLSFEVNFLLNFSFLLHSIREGECKIF